MEQVIRSGLGCIPAASKYHQAISDVIRWHREHPDDWRATWREIEKKWQDDVDCVPGDPFNIDAKLNGAYVALGLLYGEGDFERTLEITTRCGQDSDCAGTMYSDTCFEGTCGCSTVDVCMNPSVFDGTMKACEGF